MALDELADVGRDPMRGRLLPARFRRRRADAAGVVRRGGRPPRPRRGDRPQRQPLGLVGTGAGGPAPWSPAATWTRCPAAARSTGRSAWSSALAAVDRLRGEGFTPARPLARGRVRRGGGRPVRRALPGLPAAHRRARPAPTRRRCTDADGVTLADAARRAGLDPAGSAPTDAAGADRRLRRAARRAGPRAGRPGRGGRRGDAIWPHGRWRFSSPARATTPARPRWTTGTTRCCLRRDRAGRAPGRGQRRRARHASAGSCRPGRYQRDRAPCDAWLDARGRRPADVRRTRRRDRRGRAGRGRRDGTVAAHRSRSAARWLRRGAARPVAARAGRRAPVLPTGAGHDAGSSPPPACRPRCCSCATRPACPMRRRSTPTRRLRGRRDALAAVLHRLAGHDGRTAYWCELRLAADGGPPGVLVEAAGDRS